MLNEKCVFFFLNENWLNQIKISEINIFFKLKLKYKAHFFWY